MWSFFNYSMTSVWPTFELYRRTMLLQLDTETDKHFESIFLGCLGKVGFWLFSKFLRSMTLAYLFILLWYDPSWRPSVNVNVLICHPQMQLYLYTPWVVQINCVIGDLKETLPQSKNNLGNNTLQKCTTKGMSRA